jgi:hypothetical protein
MYDDERRYQDLRNALVVKRAACRHRREREFLTRRIEDVEQRRDRIRQLQKAAAR